MTLRRLFLVVICCASVLAMSSQSTMSSQPTASSEARADSDAQILNLLNRTAFGPTASEVAHVRDIGIDRYIDEQLDPEKLPEPPDLTARLAPLDRLTLDTSQLYKRYGPLTAAANGGVAPTQEQYEARIRGANTILQQASAARVYRALYSPRQLQEVMVDFWFNHFNIYAYKGFDLLWIGNYEADAIRPHVLGRFRDLLLATAQHPAMIYYLDSQTSTAPGSRFAKGEFSGINENYAREIMELHTLGVDGGYTQADVTTLARIFTGWGFDYAHLDAGAGSAFGFDPLRHDDSDKVFLGEKIAGGGEAEGVAAIDLLAKSPATAHHIAFELAQYFVADNPPPALVDRLAQRFTETDGDIKAVMKTLLTSAEFRDSAGDKYKTPYQYVLSAVRAAGVEVNNPEPLLGTMAQLGEPLYLCPTPDGYKNTEREWLSGGATNLRANFAALLAGGAFLLYAPPAAAAAANPMAAAMTGPAPAAPQLVAQTAPAPAADLKPRPVDPAALETLLDPILSERTRATVAEAPAWLKATLLLGSPDFMRR